MNIIVSLCGSVAFVSNEEMREPTMFSEFSVANADGNVVMNFTTENGVANIVAPARVFERLAEFMKELGKTCDSMSPRINVSSHGFTVGLLLNESNPICDKSANVFVTCDESMMNFGFEIGTYKIVDMRLKSSHATMIGVAISACAIEAIDVASDNTNDELDIDLSRSVSEPGGLGSNKHSRSRLLIEPVFTDERED